jgi:hypothetical protein
VREEENARIERRRLEVSELVLAGKYEEAK